MNKEILKQILFFALIIFVIGCVSLMVLNQYKDANDCESYCESENSIYISNSNHLCGCAGEDGLVRYTEIKRGETK